MLCFFSFSDLTALYKEANDYDELLFGKSMRKQCYSEPLLNSNAG